MSVDIDGDRHDDVGIFAGGSADAGYSASTCWMTAGGVTTAAEGDWASATGVTVRITTAMAVAATGGTVRTVCRHIRSERNGISSSLVEAN